MHNKRRGSFRYGRSGFGLRLSGSREMCNATCMDCGLKTEVPFQPYGGRSVYCRECYQSHIPKRY